MISTGRSIDYKCLMTLYEQRIGAAMERESGRLTPDLRTDIRKLIVMARLDYVVLFLVIADMVFKPTGDDAGLLDRHGGDPGRWDRVHPEPTARAGRGARGAGAVRRVGQPTGSSLVTFVSAWSISVTARSTSSSLTVSGGAMRRQLAEPAL